MKNLNKYEYVLKKPGLMLFCFGSYNRSCKTVSVIKDYYFFRKISYENYRGIERISILSSTIDMVLSFLGGALMEEASRNLHLIRIKNLGVIEYYEGNIMLEKTLVSIIPSVPEHLEKLKDISVDFANFRQNREDYSKFINHEIEPKFHYELQEV